MPGLLIYQTGDYRTAFERFAEGGAETYHDQRRSVDFVAEIARTCPVTVAHLSGPEGGPRTQELAPGLTSIAVPPPEFHSRGFGRRLVAEVAPDMALPRSPNVGLIDAATARGCPTFPCLADTFAPVEPAELLRRSGIQRLRLNTALRRVARRPALVAMGNHSLGATLSLHRVLGLPLERAVPWEWTRLAIRETTRSLPQDRLPEVLFVGTLSEAKGAGDLADAVACVNAGQPRLRLTLIGDGPLRPALAARAQSSPQTLQVTGPLPKAEVRARMAAADIACIPSRLDYAEGLPNALVEGLAMRLPVVASAHPAYTARFRDGQDCLFAAPSNPAALAACLLRLADDPLLFAHLSERAATAYRSLFVGASWYDVVGAFVADPVDRTGWVARHALSSLAPGEEGHDVVAARRTPRPTPDTEEAPCPHPERT
ncbi:MAG: glycosyltransferase family 4 protein [Pseudomonadota bacterium]